MKINLIVIGLLIIWFNNSLVQAETLNCKNAKRLFEENRQALRKSYGVTRGNWLNCLKKQAIEAKQQYCKTSIQKPLKTSIKKQLEANCKTQGFSWN